MASMSDYVQAHKTLIVGGGLIVLVVAGYMMSKKATTKTPTGTTADLSGLTNGLVYVPTSTNFTTENQSGIFASNDPQLTSVTNSGAINSPNNSSNSITKTFPISQPPPSKGPPTQPPPTKRPPPKQAPPPETGGGLLGPGVRFFPNYKNGVAYYRGPHSNGIVPVPLPANTVYVPGANGRMWYQSPPGSPNKLLTSG